MRKRMTPPEAWADYEIITAFPYPENYPGRAFYRFLFNYAEDSGVFDLDFGTMCMLFAPREDPFGPQALERWYRKLVGIERVVEFRSRGKAYGWLASLHRENVIDHPTRPQLPLPAWVVWRGVDVFGRERHKWCYEIIWDEVPSARRAVSEPEDTRPRVSPAAPGEIVKYDEGTTQYDLACEFRHMILDVAPGARVPMERPYDLRRWSLVMGLMLDSGATTEDIRQAIDYIRKDPLWNKRIRTPDNMRDNWVALSKHMLKGRSPVPGIDLDAVPASFRKQADLARQFTEPGGQ